jgi:hypothetical protein
LSLLILMALMCIKAATPLSILAILLSTGCLPFTLSFFKVRFYLKVWLFCHPDEQPIPS